MTTIALCGAGFIAGAHATAAKMLGLPVAGVASRTLQRAQELAAQIKSTAMTYDQLPAGADIVAVCTPPQQHVSDTLRLLDAGCAVLLEKPLCTTLVDADRLLAKAASHGERVLYAENLAYAPVVSQLLNRVGQLGAINHLEVRTIQSLPTWGSFTTDAWGGGALFDLGVHPLALAVLVAGAAGAGSPSSVSATLVGGVGHNSDEHAEVEVTFRHGLVAHVVSSWKGQPDQMQWDVQVSSDSGVLRADFWPEPTLEHNGDAVHVPTTTTVAPFIEQLGYLGQLRAFEHDQRSGARPFMDVAFGRLILDLVCCAYQSASRGGQRECRALQRRPHPNSVAAMARSELDAAALVAAAAPGAPRRAARTPTARALAPRQS